MEDFKLESKIKFHVSGIEHSVSAEDVSPNITLNTYLRDKLHLTGTKKMCLEGGCGCCIVAIEEQAPYGNKKVLAVNSCLVSLFSCHGWRIITNEGIGNPLKGYHKIQTVLADNNGTQCGFCSSGMVMNMYALQSSGPKTNAELEDSFGGNLCRCTGYRPILTAFKKLASYTADIEEFKLCTNECGTVCRNTCNKKPVYFDLLKTKWIKVFKLKDLLSSLRSLGDKTYMLVGGNTARGVYWQSESSIPDVYIDVTIVEELKSHVIEDNFVTVGANTTLTDTIELFKKVAKDKIKFSYLDKLANHLNKVAHVPVRNIGTIAGNLMIKHTHNEFPSDVFLILETVKARLVIVDTKENEWIKSPHQFLSFDMNKKVIKRIELSPYGEDWHYTSYKIMPRAQNAHAMVNAGFLFQLSSDGVVQSATIVYGGIDPSFVHALKTEALSKNQQLFNNDVLQNVFTSLDKELIPNWTLPDAAPEFRKQLAINLFYKFVLNLAPENRLSTIRNKSGGTELTRPVSTGTQQIYSDKSLYPLTQPINKIEALAQTSGQAAYVIDQPDQPRQLHAVFVKTEAIPGSQLTDINVEKALAHPGVVAFYSAKDIPGKNLINLKNLMQSNDEELFCSGKVKYFSQPLGIIVATTHDAAVNAVGLVKYTVDPPKQRPLFTIKEVLNANMDERILHETTFRSKRTGKDVKHVIKGETSLGGQYHFHMENQTCNVIPTENGFEVYPSTQWVDNIQGSISQILNMPSQKINMFVRRVGGAFGGKLSRSCYVGCAAALAAYHQKKPVKMWMNLNDNMDFLGKRYPFYCNYDVGVNDKGVIQYLKAKLYSDKGIGSNEPSDHLMVPHFLSGYAVDTWDFDTFSVMTDRAPYCFARAPGSTEGICGIEAIMEHISLELKLDAVSVKLANIDKEVNPMLIDMIKNVTVSAQINERVKLVEQFNKDNRWKKKGLTVVPMKWYVEVAADFTTLVYIYHFDGGVAVTHGGIEIGQGINTKVAQVCAYKFGIPLEKVSVQPTYNVCCPNADATGGSITTEGVVYALIRACDILLDRIKPIRVKNPRDSWEDLIQKCFSSNISLSANGFYSQDEPGIQNYVLYGCGALELEVDILTGEHQILRVDILEDVGQSMSPLLDIGQLEGAFVMGLGYHAFEELIYDPTTGRLTNDRSWNYKVPGAKDIPQDFRVGFVNDSFNPVGVLKSKVIAEAPLCLSCSYPMALRHAVGSARAESNQATETWYPIDGPSTVENTLLNASNDFKQYTL